MGDLEAMIVDYMTIELDVKRGNPSVIWIYGQERQPLSQQNLNSIQAISKRSLPSMRALMLEQFFNLVAVFKPRS